MGIDQPLRTGIVQVGQSAFLECFRGILVARNRTFGVAGDRLVYPLNPFRRVEPVALPMRSGVLLARLGNMVPRGGQRFFVYDARYCLKQGID